MNISQHLPSQKIIARNCQRLLKRIEKVKVINKIKPWFYEVIAHISNRVDMNRAETKVTTTSITELKGSKLIDQFATESPESYPF